MQDDPTKDRPWRGDEGELENRRFESIRLLSDGLGIREIAARLGVAPQTVNRWRRDFKDGGARALKSRGPRGFKGKLTECQVAHLRQLLVSPGKSPPDGACGKLPV